MTAEPAAPPAVSGRHVLRGGVRVFLADGLLLPTGLLTAAYLARRLGPDGYGLFTVAAALLAWIEWSLTSLFSRASVRFVADAADWRPVGSTIVSLHLGLATAGGVLLAVLAAPVAALMGAPALAGPLRLFAADIPLFCLAQAHHNILVGLGNFDARAVAAAARWLTRLVLVVVFVELGLSVNGAILGSIGASLVELAVCRAFVRPAFSAHAALAVRKLWGYAAPLMLSALALRLYDKLDLVALTALGGTPADAGLYGAAQNLSILPGLFAASFSPLLITVITRAYREHGTASAGRIGREAMRWVLLLVPLVCLAAGAASDIIALVFGRQFTAAAPLLPPLLFGALALVLVSVTTAILLAVGRPGLTLVCTGPLPLVGGLGYLLLIPRAGALGAAWVTCSAAVLVALGLVLTVYGICRALPPAATVVRSGLVGAGTWAAAAAWPAAGAMVPLKLALIGAGAVLALVLAGELTPAEVGAIRSWWQARTARG